MPVTAVLEDAAFGDDPGRWPLPAAATPHDVWLRAVAAGGQGRYGSAMADLATLRRLQPGRLVSLAHSTHASFLRQLGWHHKARGFDGRALALANDDPEATADALIGLAADALGVGRFAASARLLDQALLPEDSDRLPIRLAWVSAELAMARGDGTTAVGHAHRAVDLAQDFGSARHAVKSQVVLAAALCSVGELDRSRKVADDALQACDRLGMVPLRWALACLLVGIGGTVHSSTQVLAIRDKCADTVRRRGGVWSDR
ncbi:hypothetical protein [Mycobacterium hubeiense]|uniref:hypothetical protein n=1 Tax=Mycobacterium hubeiense TaxID=1867256 RepID=UPI000C7F6D38|nr:hypothetical protein [Mycobacterium sp. QGD 101]